MGELPSFTGDNESSSEKKGDSSKGKQERWVAPPPLVPRGLELRRDIVPTPRPPLEQMLSRIGPEKPDDDDEESESDTDEVVAEQPAADGEQSEGSEETTHAEATEAEEPIPQEGLPGGTEPFAGELPDVEAFEPADGQAQEEAPEQPDEGLLQIHRNQPTVPEAITAPVEDEHEQPQPTSASWGTTPPPPTAPPTPSAAEQWPGQNWNTPLSPTEATGFSPNVAPSITLEQHQSEVNDAEYYAEKRGLRRGLVAGFITGYVVKAYLANRKRARYEKAAEIQVEKRDEQIARMQREQWQQTERMTAQAEADRRRQEQQAYSSQNSPERAAKPAEALPAAESQPEQVFDQEGNRITLQPGWRVERSAGGYSVVLDEHNRVVHDAIHYGEAFQRDQKREQLSDDMFAVLGGAQPGVPLDDGVTAPAAADRQQDYQSYQQGDLPGQHPAADLNHRLPEPRNQLTATVTSPWLWTALAILVIVYFIAQLA